MLPNAEPTLTTWGCGRMASKGNKSCVSNMGEITLVEITDSTGALSNCPTCVVPALLIKIDTGQRLHTSTILLRPSRVVMSAVTRV